VTRVGYALDAPDAVLLRSNESGVHQTRDAAGRGSGYLSPDGRFVYYLKDDHGSETGTLVRVPFAGGAEEAMTTDLPPHGLDGVTFDRSGAIVVYATSDRRGYHMQRVQAGKRMPPRQIQELEKRLAELDKDFAIHWFDAGHGSLSIGEQTLEQRLALDFFDGVRGRVRLAAAQAVP
jgi:hypothetical protein